MLGLIATVPLLLRVRARTGSWRVSITLVVAFAVIFALSTAVTRSAIGGGADTSRRSLPTTLPSRVSPNDHEAHH